MSDSSINSYIQSSLGGALRGGIVQCMIFPLTSIKIQKQVDTTKKTTITVIREMYRNGGIGSFYRGLWTQLTRTTMKQVWSWPMITGIPDYLNQYHVQPLYQQAITAYVISTIDAFMTPLDKLRIMYAVNDSSKSTRPWFFLSKEGWKGVVVNWTRLWANWSAFLVFQKILRDKERERTKTTTLTLCQTIKVGAEVAGIVSFLSAPIDMANTLVHSRDISLRTFFKRYSFYAMFRGSPLNFLGLMIHNIASVVLLELLGQGSSKYPEREGGCTILHKNR